MGAPLGSLIGMAMGGIVAALWGRRGVFLVAGAPGILLAALAWLTLREPRRGTMRQAVPAAYDLWPTSRMLLASRTFVLIALASALDSAWVGGGYAAALGPVPAPAHATASALMLFIMNLIELGPGLLCVGLLGDAFAGSLGPGGGLRCGMAITTLFTLTAAGCFWAAQSGLARETVD